MKLLWYVIYLSGLIKWNYLRIGFDLKLFIWVTKNGQLTSHFQRLSHTSFYHPQATQLIPNRSFNNSVTSCETTTHQIQSINNLKLKIETSCNFIFIFQISNHLSLKTETKAEEQ